MNIKLDKQGLLHLVSGTVPPVIMRIGLEQYGNPIQVLEWEWDMIALAKLSEQELWGLYQDVRKRMDYDFMISPWFFLLKKPFSFTRPGYIGLTA